jgi:hypothetical protein
LDPPKGECGILATGSQEGPVNTPEIVALTRVFRLIAASGFRVGYPGDRRQKEEEQ